MKKLLLLITTSLIVSMSFGQKDSSDVPKPVVKQLPVAKQSPAAKPVVDNSELKSLISDRDTVKSQLKAKNSAYNKDNNKLTKLDGEKSRLKEQLSSAKHAKKADKIESLENKVAENNEAIKNLETQLKEEEKEIKGLEKSLKEAEKAIAKEKERMAKERSKK